MSDDADTPIPARRIALAIGAIIAFHVGVALWVPAYADRDAWFHEGYARLLLAGATPWHGLAFPWVSQSAFADLPTDWSLGWHWLVALLSAVDPTDGMKAAIVVGGAAVTAVFHLTLVRERVARPWVWTGLLLLGCAAWLFRTHMGRPTPIVVALLLLFLAALLRERLRLAAALGCVTLLTYQVPTTPALVLGAACLGLWFEQRRVPWRAALAGGAGIAFGILLHPGFWSTGAGGFLSLDHATFHLWDLMRGSIAFAADGGVLTLAEGAGARVPFPAGQQIVVPLPAELLAPTWTTFGREFPVPLLATVVGVPLALSRCRDRWSVAAAALAAFGLWSTMRSGRFIEYWHPFALLAAAQAFRPVEGRKPSHPALIVVLLLAALSQPPLLWSWVRDVDPDEGRQVEAAAKSLRGRAEPGDVVWHGAWDDFAPLFHWNPEVRWLTGMDPWYMAAKDPLLVFRHAACRGRLSQPEPGVIELGELYTTERLRGVLRDEFGARFVLLWRPAPEPPLPPVYAVIETQLRRAAWATVLHEDEHTIVFELE